MSPNGGEERRRSPRVARTFVVKYHWTENQLSKWGVSQTKDLSVSGLRFVAEQPFPVGMVVEFEVHVSTAVTPLKLKGRVMWSKPLAFLSMAEHGVEFVDLEETTKRALAQAVEFFVHRHDH